jgi:hypothetical protein
MAGKNKKTAPESGGNKRMKQEPKMSLAPPRIRSDDDFSQVFSQSQNLGENSAFYFSQSQQHQDNLGQGDSSFSQSQQGHSTEAEASFSQSQSVVVEAMPHSQLSDGFFHSSQVK